ncbi:DNA topoisomerase III [Coprococcus sp. AF21-14LB]|uniref:DNA topoisomerase III n=1 Tax=Coprococcus sp. AF21-14LB TaxID=2292231 RepID=UPI000E4AB008|nr:DNA topoisomerase III [Coprococcus sp. AF21-14LB]RGS81878.1 DNA topoisomerase III [Coprococcus sp. AF21-14LB]
MKSLVIAEKPSVGRDIARVLGCKKQIQGAIEGEKYIVTWGLGHLVTLADPEEYETGWKEWKMDYLPMMPKEWKLVVIRQTGKQYQLVKAQLFRKDVSQIIIATDAGREGELVARWILEKAHVSKPIRRLWISSVTDKAIRDGFANLKDGKDYENLYHAASARAKADWLVGMNGTRALTCKYNAQLSCGRVQTPTLAMIAKREEEIRNFKPQSYYGMRAVSKGITFQWQEERSGSGRTFDKTRVEQMKKQLERESLVITKVDRTSKKTYAPGLYDLTELQRDANKRFGFSAKETLNIMQRLYENHKVLTYPRTDSRYLSSDVVGTLKERLKACSVGPYRKVAEPLINREIRADKRFVDDAKVSDHHAIIPTEQFVQLEHMTSDERKIYDLVVRRFVAVLLPAAEYEQTVLRAEAAGETFAAKGKVMKKSGWLAAYEEEWEQEEETDDLRDQTLPNVETGDQIPVLRYEITEGKTKPPAPFNEATLLSAMENPVKYMTTKDAKAAKTLGETGGLGTVATRADIIEKLFNSFLMEKRGKDIFITSKAKQLLELVPEGLKQPELTADWEMKLSKIAKGQMKASTFMREIDAYTQEIVEEIKLGKGTFRHDNVTNKKCPQCGKPMLAVNGKNSRMLVCQDRECGYRETVARTTNARCPKCHKRMELYGKGDAQTFICACGYKEKLSAFEARRAKEGKGVSKRDVQKYLNQQKKEAAEPINNAFAAALANLNLPEK